MKNFRLNIDGKEVFGIPGQTILEVARENDIFIPTLCYDERTKIYGSCGLCMTEVNDCFFQSEPGSETFLDFIVPHWFQKKVFYTKPESMK